MATVATQQTTLLGLIFDSTESYWHADQRNARNCRAKAPRGFDTNEKENHFGGALCSCGAAYHGAAKSFTIARKKIVIYKEMEKTMSQRGNLLHIYLYRERRSLV